MITQPLFKIQFDFNSPTADLLKNPVLEKIVQSFKERGIEIDRSIEPVIEKENERWAFVSIKNKWYRVVKTESGFDVYEEKYERHYTSTFIPTLITFDDNNKQNLLIELYKEVCSSWKSLTDVRFKLLGFVPAVSVIAWGQLLSSDGLKSTPGTYAGIFISMLGLLVTIALRIYDLRNDSLYDDLISRGRKIEEELAIDTGIFRGRRNPPTWWINHSIPVKLIYGSAMAGWLMTAIWFLLITLNITD